MRAHMRGGVRAYARMCIHVQIYARVGACKSCPCPFPPHCHHVHGPRVHRVCERTQVPVVYGAVSHARTHTHTHTHAQQKRQYNCEAAMRSCSGGAAARHNFKKVIHLNVFIHLLACPRAFEIGVSEIGVSFFLSCWQYIVVMRGSEREAASSRVSSSAATGVCV